MGGWTRKKRKVIDRVSFLNEVWASEEWRFDIEYASINASREEAKAP
jgi:hypothetical protein